MSDSVRKCQRVCERDSRFRLGYYSNQILEECVRFIYNKSWNLDEWGVSLTHGIILFPTDHVAGGV